MKLRKFWRVSKLETEKTDQNVAGSFRSLELSNPAALDSKECISRSTNTVELDEHARDSGYGSAASTPASKDTASPLRKPGQIPTIQQIGLCVSKKAMEPKAKRRFLEVQLEIEKMLLEFIRKLKSGPGIYKPIAIRPMMLGKTDSDADAKSYMVVICSEDIRRKVQDFFDEPLVKSLCEPADDDDVPSFKALVIGHALRLRASTSDISVQCSSMHSLYDGTTTFCGMPIHLCDERGHSRKATFGGIVKVISNDGEYQLYGLTAGHIIRDGQITTDEDDTIMDTWDGSGLVDLGLSQDNHTGTGSPAVSDNDQDGQDNWCLRNQRHLGKVLNAGRGEALVDEDYSQRKPYLDWALFELNVHRPNELAHHDQEYTKGDLHLPFSIIDPRKSGIPVSMLCASQGVKHGMLSTTCARVLLGRGGSFTDAYTLSLEGSEINDGDSGSWVVDGLRLEVYGHVVADDVFGDVYVIPMSDILADIKRCLGAESVDLPSGLDIVSMASISQLAAGMPEDMSHFANQGEGSLLVAQRGHAVEKSTPSDFLPRSLPSSSVEASSRPVSVPSPAAVIAYPGYDGRAPRVDLIESHILVNDDSGYGSSDGTPDSSPVPPTLLPDPHDEHVSKPFRRRISKPFTVADRSGMTTLDYRR